MFTKRKYAIRCSVRNQISTIDEWLDNIDDMKYDPDYTIDSIHPAQSTALLYEEIQDCQDGK
jgi:hypothetical protein